MYVKGWQEVLLETGAALTVPDVIVDTWSQSTTWAEVAATGKSSDKNPPHPPHSAHVTLCVGIIWWSLRVLGTEMCSAVMTLLCFKGHHAVASDPANLYLDGSCAPGGTIHRGQWHDGVWFDITAGVMNASNKQYLIGGEVCAVCVVACPCPCPPLSSQLFSFYTYS